MIIGGAISIVLALTSLLGSSAASIILDGTGDELETVASALVIASVICLIAAALRLAAGIIGVKNYTRPEKALGCIILGAATFVIGVAGTIINGGTILSIILNIILSAIIPGLYIYGAYLNFKEQEQTAQPVYVPEGSGDGPEQPEEAEEQENKDW